MSITATITTGLASEGGHWYREDGSPAYCITGANGKVRAVTLRDARKHGLYPGVTSILNEAAKPGLERWKIQQAILAALTLPRLDNETDTEFAARALLDSQEQARAARERGTLLHAALDQSFRGDAPAPEYWQHVGAVGKLLQDKFPGICFLPERSFASPLGYGGRVDLHAREPAIVLDVKSKGTVAEWEAATVYDEHGMQLSAYAAGLELGCATVFRGVIFVCVDAPLAKLVEVPEGEALRHLGMFHALLQYWQEKKGLFPPTRGKP